MLSRILLGVVSAVAGVIVIAASAASAGPDDGPSADAASAPLPELMVAPPTDFPDVRLLNGYAFNGQAAFDPANPKRLVVGVVSATGCYVKTSADGGKTWGTLVRLPQLENTECSFELPAVTYAAGGSRLYAAYIYTRLDAGCLNGVAVSVSTDQGATWSTPTRALDEAYSCGGPSPFAREEGYNAVRVAAAPDGPWVYVAAQDFAYHDHHIHLGRSGDRGASWTGRIVAYSFTYDADFRGFALAAGRSGNVLVALGYEYYDFSYHMYVVRSTDYGVTVDYPVADEGDSFLLSDPDIKIGPSGTAHLVYEEQHNPGTAILYKFSLPPYSTWSTAPVRLDDVQQGNLGAPQLAVGTCGQASVLHATWLESLDVSDFPSKVLYTRKVARPGYAWSDPLKVGTLKNGIYTNGLAAAGPKAFSVFAGRTAPDPQNKWGIAGSRVSSGVTCP